MVKKSLWMCGLLMVFLGFSPQLMAQAAKTLLDTKIVLVKEGPAKVSYDAKGSAAEEIESNKIQTALVLYAVAMNKSDAETQKALLAQMKSAVGKIGGTDKGLVRADFIQGSPLLKNLTVGPEGQTLVVNASEIPGKGVSFDIKPPEVQGGPLVAAALSLFQDLVNKLSGNGLRFLTIAMGGMNKWYSEMGQASDPASISKAPGYALTLAADIVEKIYGKKTTGK